MTRKYEDHELDDLLRDHLAAELDAQRGRAGRAFEAHVARQAGRAAGRQADDSADGTSAPTVLARRERFRAFARGAIAMGLAASLGFLVVHVFMQVAGPGPIEQAQAPSEPSAPPAPVAAVVPRVEAPRVDAPPVHLTSETQPQQPQPQPRWEQVHVVNSITMDKGTVVVDEHTPARAVRHVEMERTQWFDRERGVRVETVVPREGMQLFLMDTY